MADETGADVLTSPDDNPTLRLLRDARGHLSLRRFDLAVDVATQAIRLDPKRSETYVIRAEALRKLNKSDRALADLTLAIRLAPDCPAPYVIRAEIYRGRCQHDQTIADATQAIFLDPSNAAAFSIRASCRLSIGDREGAAADQEELFRIDPTRPPVHTPNSEKPGSPLTTVPVERDAYRDLFADGKPVDRTYRSRPAVSDEDAPEALGVASGYKPETIGKPIPRQRSARRGPQGTPILLGVVLLGLLGVGYVLINQDRGSQDAKPKGTVRQAAVSEAVLEPEPVQSASSTASVGSDGASAEPGGLADVPPGDATRLSDRSPVGLSARPTSPTEPVTTRPQGGPSAPSIEGIRRLEGHTRIVNDTAFSPDSKWLATASGDSTVRLWNTAAAGADSSHITLGTGTSQPPKGFIRVEYSPDGNRLAASNMDGRILLWDSSVIPPRLLRTLGQHDNTIVSIAFSPDGKSLATGGRNDGLVCIWDLSDPGVPLAASIPPEKNGVTSLAYSPDGRSLFECVSFPKPGEAGGPGKPVTPGQIWVWDLSRRPFVKKLVLRDVRSIILRSLVFSPDGKHVAYCEDEAIRILDATTGKVVKSIERPLMVLVSIAYTPDGRHLLSGGYDKIARLWDVETGQVVLEYGDSTLGIDSVAVSPDGRFAAIGGHEKTTRLLKLR